MLDSIGTGACTGIQAPVPIFASGSQGGLFF